MMILRIGSATTDADAEKTEIRTISYALTDRHCG